LAKSFHKVPTVFYILPRSW